MSIQHIKKKYTKKLKRKGNVLGVAIGEKVSDGVATGEQAITIFVEKKKPLAQLKKDDMVPKELKGYKTDVIETGRIVAFSDPTKKYRPAPGGVSIGHYAITAGTLGCVVRKNGKRFILSNNHVLANSNSAKIGDSIYQPGPHDGGTPADKISQLAQFVPIDFGGTQPPPPPPEEDDDKKGWCPIANMFAKITNFAARSIGSSYRVLVEKRSATNYVDCALAGPVGDEVLDDILDIGSWSGWLDNVDLYIPVKKMGRTTGYTEDKIIHRSATIDVDYGGGRVATFDEQLMAGPMSAGGDSGSLILHRDTNQAIGLLFAGSPSVTIINPIQFVIDALGITI
jgi:hypothetical protein